jgi:hypothetical protein
MHCEEEGSLITLHIYCLVAPQRHGEFEQAYHQFYVPAISVQAGFQSTTLLRPNSAVPRSGSQPRDDWSYEIDIAFDSEESRLTWVASREHGEAWPKVAALCERFQAQGFDIIA